MDNSVDPIRDLRAINNIKQMTKSKPRDYLLFIMGINNGIRITDLLDLKWEQVADKQKGDVVQIRERKTGKQNYIVVNGAVAKALRLYREKLNPEPDCYLFRSRKGKTQPVTVTQVNRLVKSWCQLAGLSGRYGSRTLRKTFGYVQRVHHGVGFDVLAKRYNHSSPRVTMVYLGIMDDEVKDILMNEI
jgi:integrase